MRRNLWVFFLLGFAAASFADAETVAWYRFEDGTPGGVVTLAQDTRLAVGHNGTPLGADVTFSADVPLLGGGLANHLSAFFDGTSGQAINFGYTFPLHEPLDRTLEFFLKIDHSSHDGIFWTRTGDWDRNRFNIYTTHPGAATSFGFDYRDVNGVLHPLANPVAFSLELDRWTHIAIVRSGNAYEFFRDGVSQGTTQDLNPNLPTSGSWELSGRTGYDFRGYIDEIRISDGALQPTEFLISGVAAVTGLIGDLVNDVVALGLQRGISTALRSVLDSALNALDDLNENNDVAAVNSMNAFMNQVEAQRGNKLTDGEANELIRIAEAVLALLE